MHSLRSLVGSCTITIILTKYAIVYITMLESGENEVLHNPYSNVMSLQQTGFAKSLSVANLHCTLD